MGKIAALALTLFCGVILLVLVRSAAFIVSGGGTFGGGGLPIEYASFSAIAIFAGYGFYAGLRALLTPKASVIGTGEQFLPESRSKPIRRIGWTLVIFG
jgi:membrane protein implicated in regulation of membrane protease activity